VPYEQLWTPWRLTYIQGQDQLPATPDDQLQFLPGAESKCFICRDVADSQDRQNLVVQRGQHTITILNRYPYNNGHLLVAPILHKGTLAELTDEEHLECQRTLVQFTKVLTNIFKPEGFNIGLNLGRVAGAGLPGHLHWHIVPRWSGDTSFMPVMAGVRLIPQSLESLWEAVTDQLRG